MKKSNKILVALAFLGLSACVATTTVAQTWNIGATAADNVTATISGSGTNLTLTISGNGAMQDFSYPSYAPWYDIRENIKNLVINSGVTNIGDYAFQDCSSLTGTLTIPNSVTTIGNVAFDGCSGFTGALNIPNSVYSIGIYAFSSCSGLTSITIPNSVTTVENCPFSNCGSLTTINVDANNQYYSSDNGILYNKNKTTLIKCPEGKTGTVIIPNTVNSIGDFAFQVCSGLTSVIIGNSVNSIGIGAFYECSGLTGALTIPNSVTSIGMQSFYNCSGLTSVIIGNLVNSIGGGAFYNCSGLVSLTIGSSLNSITSFSFPDFTSLTTINVDANNQYYSSDDGVLYNKNKTILIRCPIGKIGTLTIPNSVTTIENAFWGVAFTINGLEFWGYIGLTDINVDIDNQYYSSYDGILYNKDKTTLIQCPAGKIGTATISNTVTSIENFSFVGCSSLTSINILKSTSPVPTVTSSIYTFYDVPANIPINVPCGMKTHYENSTEWSSVFNNFQEPSLPIITVESNSDEMGSASVIQQPTCENSEAIIEATANSGYCFIQWNDGNTNSTRTVLLTSDITLTAIFSAIPIVTVESNNSIMGSASVTQHPTCENSEAVISATANSDYKFVKWSDEDTENPRTVTVTEDITFTAIFESESGIENIKENEINIYPNPVKSQLRITNYELQEGNFTIFNITGQAVGAGFKPDHNAHNGETTIDVSHLPSGVYFVKVGNMVGKFIKE